MALLVAGGLGLIAIFLSYFMGEFVLKLVYGAEYIAYADAFVLTMVAGFILYLATVLGYTLTAIGFIKQQIYLFSIVLVFSVLILFFEFEIISIKKNRLAFTNRFSTEEFIFYSNKPSMLK